MSLYLFCHCRLQIFEIGVTWTLKSSALDCTRVSHKLKAKILASFQALPHHSQKNLVSLFSPWIDDIRPYIKVRHADLIPFCRLVGTLSSHYGNTQDSVVKERRLWSLSSQTDLYSMKMKRSLNPFLVGCMDPMLTVSQLFTESCSQVLHFLLFQCEDNCTLDSLKSGRSGGTSVMRKYMWLNVNL